MDNNLYDRGEGEWMIGIYNPPIILGPFSGLLTTSKEYYVVKTEFDKYIANIPSQNVSYCVNVEVCKGNWKKGINE